MREIKFRAKTCKGEWVDGYYVKAQKLNNKGDEHYIIEYESTGATYLIDKNTVCQYTGLKDKNGKEIWENDIVCFQFDNDNCTLPYTDTKKRYGKIFFSDYRASFAIAMGRNGSKSMNNDLYKYVQCGNRVEVIGNIFDNPELLDADKQASKYADNDVMKPAT